MASFVCLNHCCTAKCLWLGSALHSLLNLQITDKDMERLLILYNSKKIELNTNSHREEDLKPNSSNSKVIAVKKSLKYLILNTFADMLSLPEISYHTPIFNLKSAHDYLR